MFFFFFFFCLLSSFLSPSLDSINLLKFSKSHYQPCRGINSDITKAIISFFFCFFFITGYYFNFHGVLPGNETVFFCLGGGGGGGGGGEGGAGGGALFCNIHVISLK